MSNFNVIFLMVLRTHSIGKNCDLTVIHLGKKPTDGPIGIKTYHESKKTHSDSGSDPVATFSVSV
jgi:hypothetical protein